MKLKLKTQEALLREGWKLGGSSRRFGLYYGTLKEPEMQIAYYDASALLGRELDVIDIDFEDRAIPRVRVKSTSRTAWLPVYAFEGEVSHKDYQKHVERERIAGEKFAYHKMFARFEIGCRDWSEKDALKAAAWVAGQLGYKLVKRAKV